MICTILAALMILPPAATLPLSPRPQESDPAPGLAGTWKGELELLPGLSLTVVLRVVKEGDGYKASLDSPDQGSRGIPVDEIKREGQKVSFTARKIDASYEGTLSDDGQILDGTFIQRGRPSPLKLGRAEAADLPPKVSAPGALQGLWEGAIKAAGGIELRLLLRVEKADDDPSTLVPYLDSPDQGVRGIPVTAIALNERDVTFEVKSIGAKFSGVLDADSRAITGVFQQLGAKMDLVLRKTDRPTELKRPQEPKPPFPYRSEEVSFTNPEAPGVTLAGTLTIPPGDGPFPGAVLVTGSGPQDRDESLLGHKPFLVLADDLTRRGIAVLRYDDRGTAGSTGNFAEATTQDFASDALAAVRFLKTRKELATDRIGIIGHSEGGLVASMAATQALGEVAFVVLMAAPGVPGDEIVIRQQALIARASGLSEATVATLTRWNTHLLRRLREGADDAVLQRELEAMNKEQLDGLSKEDRDALSALGGASAVEAHWQQLRSPWFRFFLSYDPRPALRQLRCPVLAIHGEKDLQVDPAQNLGEIEKALREGGASRFKVVELPGLNHLFQPSQTGIPGEYGKIETTIDPRALETIGNWVVEVTKGD